mmetsp:Transcript_25469/g.46020  ORF Transcript_25469/g.46020 Transcript_25469/m.46020 type:complete len:561 (-) Transcript_25469:1885-3567(-)
MLGVGGDLGCVPLPAALLDLLDALVVHVFHDVVAEHLDVLPPGELLLQPLTELHELVVVDGHGPVLPEELHHVSDQTIIPPLHNVQVRLGQPHQHLEVVFLDLAAPQVGDGLDVLHGVDGDSEVAVPVFVLGADVVGTLHGPGAAVIGLAVEVVVVIGQQDAGDHVLFVDRQRLWALDHFALPRGLAGRCVGEESGAALLLQLLPVNPVRLLLLVFCIALELLQPQKAKDRVAEGPAHFHRAVGLEGLGGAEPAAEHGDGTRCENLFISGAVVVLDDDTTIEDDGALVQGRQDGGVDVLVLGVDQHGARELNRPQPLFPVRLRLLGPPLQLVGEVDGGHHAVLVVLHALDFMVFVDLDAEGLAQLIDLCLDVVVLEGPVVGFGRRGHQHQSRGSDAQLQEGSHDAVGVEVVAVDDAVGLVILIDLTVSDMAIQLVEHGLAAEGEYAVPCQVLAARELLGHCVLPAGRNDQMVVGLHKPIVSHHVLLCPLKVNQTAFNDTDFAFQLEQDVFMLEEAECVREPVALAAVGVLRKAVAGDEDDVGKVHVRQGQQSVDERQARG